MEKTNKPDPDFLNHFSVEPLTIANWSKFVRLFGENGACGNCWCMYYRLNKAAYLEGKADGGNKAAMYQLVKEHRPTGMLAFIEDEPVAWCALAPREHFTRLEKSRVHKRIDEKQVWSIPCFFVAKKYRRAGLSLALLNGVIGYAKKNCIPVLEAYPTVPTTSQLPDSFLWIGLYKTFERAGFEIVNRRSKNRPMVRYDISRNKNSN